MILPVAVITPSRDRPEKLAEIYGSMLATSDQAVMLAYVDGDQEDRYREVLYAARIEHAVDRGKVRDLRAEPRLRLLIGTRLGPIHSINMVVHRNPDHLVYGVCPDDSVFKTVGWDHWCLEEREKARNFITALSPAHNGGDLMNFPFVTREWIDACGWLAYPNAYHFYWDSIVEMLGEASQLTYATPEQFLMQHNMIVADDKPRLLEEDAVLFASWCIHDRRDIVKRIRAAIAR